MCESLGITRIKSLNNCNKEEYLSVIEGFNFIGNNAEEFESNNTNNSYTRARRIIDEI